MENIDIVELSGIILATIVGVASFILTIKNERKLASKEHELTEGLKADILQLLAIFSSIQYKRKLKGHFPKDITIDDEIVALTKARLTSGYVYLMYCIQDEDDRFIFEIRIQQIINGQISIIDAGRYACLLIETLFLICNEAKLGEEIRKIIEKMYNDEILREVDPKIPSEFEGFVKYLIKKGVTNPDVRLFHGVFENNVDIVKKALDDGADAKCTDKMIVERYENEYKEFLKSNNIINPLK